MNEVTKKKIPGPKLNIKNDCIDLSHGSGGRAMAKLIDQMFLPAFDNPMLSAKNDQACFTVTEGRMVMTTDSYVISPLFFPGGNIGSLAVHGTVNDLAMSGAKPLYLSAGFIIEEGFPLSDLKTIISSMAEAAKQAGVSIVTGDTKVVERGKGDGMFINTTGIGSVPKGIFISGDQAKPGDKVIISGFIGDHGIAILSKRNNLEFTTHIESDSSALNGLVDEMLKEVPQIRCLRDPTRGGVATTLNEWAGQSEVGFIIDEGAIPIRQEVRSACELLGLDPLYIANEGKLLAICPSEQASTLLKKMKHHPLGKNAAVIGEVIEDSCHFVQLRSIFGGSRIIDWLNGEQLPRIC